MNKAEKQFAMSKIVEGVEKGMTIKLACEYAGLNGDSLYHSWVKTNRVLEAQVKQAKANYSMELLPQASKKEPFKMLQALNPGEYSIMPETAVQVNIDNRPLSEVPSDQLLKALKLLKSDES